MLHVSNRLLVQLPSLLLVLSSSTKCIHSLTIQQPLVKVLYDSSNSNHRDCVYHPEQPSRIQACVDWLQKHNDEHSNKHAHGTGIINKPFELLDIRVGEASSSANGSVHAEEKETTKILSTTLLEEARSILCEIHSDEYVNAIQTKCQSKSIMQSPHQKLAEEVEDGIFVGYIDHDTFLTTETYDVCLHATAIWMYCIQQILLKNQHSNNSNAFSSSSSSSSSLLKATMALTRPPGHHATQSTPNGFCIFNFAAAAAVYAISKLNNHYKKVTIIDWDVHYGQGVSDIIQNYPNIRYVSMHQAPAFPYSGQTRTIFGNYQNIKTIPIQPDSTWTCGYRHAFIHEVLPFCYDVDEWDADLVIVCAGYDALLSDELASCNLNARDFGTMTTLLMEHLGIKNSHDDKYDNDARRGNEIGLMFGLEGGYQLREGVPGGNLPEAVLATLNAVAEA